MLHRDIKPENVMLSGRHALVMDFGIAKAVADAGGEKVTTVGVAVGTPMYMSPEQATGSSDIDGRSDIYALGLLAYEMLTGRPPFDGRTAQQVLSAQVLEMPAPVTSVRTAVSAPLGEFVMRCLAKAPSDRWQTTEELVPLLEGLGTPSGGITPTTTRPVKVISVTKPDRRATMIGVAVALIVLAVGFAGWIIAGGPKAGGGGIDRIAVMPLRDISGSDAAFAESMQDALITGIAGLNLASVVPRSELAERGQSRRTRDVAKEFDADAVMDGTLFRAGDVIRINLQLVDPATLRHHWTYTREVNARNVLAAQDSMIAAIRNQVRDVLLGATRTVATSTNSPR
jgi:TolB-like protein